MNNKLFRQCSQCQISERQWGRIADAICDFQGSRTASSLQKGKQNTKQTNKKLFLWKLLVNLKLLTWLKTEEWKSLTKEIQTLQHEKKEKHNKNPLYVHNPWKQNPPKVDLD